MRLLAAVRAAASRETQGQLKPLTAFIPTDDPWLAGAVLRQGKAGPSASDKSRLHDLIEQHTVPGGYTMKSLEAEARTKGGVVVLNTLSGGHLRVIPLGGDQVIVRDDRGVEVAMAPAAGQAGDGVHIFDQLDAEVESGSR
jgi:hypothetical protein